MMRFYGLVFILTLLCTLCFCDQPAYQVSIYIQLHPKGLPIQHCNGVIIQSRLILTSAACLYYHLLPYDDPLPLHSSMLSVVAGSADAFNDVLKVKVSDINIAKSFNSTTLENDLAILRLENSLPLGMRADLKWIILDDVDLARSSCLSNFYIRSLENSMADYVQTEEMPIYKNKECAKVSVFPESRRNDICSRYLLPTGFDCNDFNTFTPYNGDRGTALVCNSRLVGILSTVLPPKNKSDDYASFEEINCSEKKVKAYFTNLAPYMDWIYEIIAYEEFLDFMEDNYKISTPYQQEASAVMETSAIDTTSTLGFDSLLTTKLSTPVPINSFTTLAYSITQNTAHRTIAGCSLLSVVITLIVSSLL